MEIVKECHYHFFWGAGAGAVAVAGDGVFICLVQSAESAALV